MQRVSLIIPTYNEAKNIPILVEEIFNIIDKTKIDLELIIVDDNSPFAIVAGWVTEQLKTRPRSLARARESVWHNI